MNEPAPKKKNTTLYIIIGVVLLGILLLVGIPVLLLGGAVGLPAFLRYQKQAMTSEATMNIEKIARGQMAYFEKNHVSRGSYAIIEKQFVDIPATPSSPAVFCETGSHERKMPGDEFDTPEWAAVDFAIGDPYGFVYEVEASGTGNDAGFTVRAIGDLDCDGIYSTFEISAIVVDMEARRSPGIFEDNPTE